jgi:hypothetical protein
MLLLPVLEKEENENGGADELLPLWRKREKHQWRGRSVVERMVVQPAVTVVVVAEGTAEKEKGEREAAEKEEKQGRWLVFLQAIKSTSIYRRWKRAILSTMEKNFSP